MVSDQGRKRPDHGVGVDLETVAQAIRTSRGSLGIRLELPDVLLADVGDHIGRQC